MICPIGPLSLKQISQTWSCVDLVLSFFPANIYWGPTRHGDLGMSMTWFFPKAFKVLEGGWIGDKVNNSHEWSDVESQSREVPTRGREQGGLLMKYGKEKKKEGWQMRCKENRPWGASRNYQAEKRVPSRWKSMFKARNAIKGMICLGNSNNFAVAEDSFWEREWWEMNLKIK